MTGITPATITARQYYQALLTVVDGVEEDCVANVRQGLRRELENLERLGLADDVWTPAVAALGEATAMTADDAMVLAAEVAQPDFLERYRELKQKLAAFEANEFNSRAKHPEQQTPSTREIDHAAKRDTP